MLPATRRRELHHGQEPVESWGAPRWAAGSPWAGTFAKLRTLQLTHFSRILVLDTDCVALRNVDHLASRSAVPRTPAFVFSAQDGGAWGLMNSGVMVLRPDGAEFERAKALMASMDARYTGHGPSRRRGGGGGSHGL